MTPCAWLPLFPPPVVPERLPLPSDIQYLGTEEGLETLFVANSLASKRHGPPMST
jgi:hypothetical protein